ncbi:RNA polymerase sigma factor [Metamycoplasma cloacale]|uniref:RNA polymerase sigma factor n=1 Tax=Metamycoplasma cloacale TaxID=92401 RepID=A0A2Z4LN04_9BACT|nr:RNA polymerase sigma factor [Metamycoplasma cloacale]AWX42798.1 RNA polymerase sigma factor [Metamycoplasma cloacale]VEU79383.1 RNA polymerase sigma factor [Metamycoplasma cloacale]
MEKSELQTSIDLVVKKLKEELTKLQKKNASKTSFNQEEVYKFLEKKKLFVDEEETNELFEQLIKQNILSMDIDFGDDDDVTETDLASNIKSSKKSKSKIDFDDEEEMEEIIDEIDFDESQIKDIEEEDLDEDIDENEELDVDSEYDDSSVRMTDEEGISDEEDNLDFVHDDYIEQAHEMDDEDEFDAESLIKDYDDFDDIKLEERQLSLKDESGLTNKLTETNDIVKWYMRWIGKYGKLLSPKEELDLAKKMEEAEKNGDKYRYKKARDMLVKRNLRLVINNAKRYKNRGLTFIDLISEGNSGIMKAVSKFDYKKGYKFSTYATWWIRQAITRAVADQARTIRVPVHMVETINKITKIERELQQELGYAPSDDEIAKKYGGDFTAEKVRYIRKINIDPISLDKSVGKEENSFYSDFVKDETVMSPTDYASHEELSVILNDMLEDSLDYEDRILIRKRFGIGKDKNGNTYRPHTLDELAKEMNLSKEKVRQLETKVLRKLKHPQIRKKLKEFFINESYDID